MPVVMHNLQTVTVIYLLSNSEIINVNVMLYRKTLKSIYV